MTTNHIWRAARICVLSMFLALAAFSFFAFGSASAHALTRSAGGAQAASSSTTTTVTTVRIIVNTHGATVFSPSTVTIQPGSSVKIVNKTAFGKILFVGASGTIVRLAPGTSIKITPAQSEDVGICGGGGLAITVV